MICGWITPSGEFIECELFKHLKKLRELGHLEDWASDFASLDEIEASCQASADAGEHPEWHCFEMAESDVSWKVRQGLLERGWARVGTFGGRELHFELSAEAYTDLRKACADVAIEKHCEPVFEIVGASGRRTERRG